MVDRVLKNAAVTRFQGVASVLLGGLALYLVLGFGAFVSAAALLEAEARRSGENPAPVAIEPGMTLRTGDAVRFRIRSQADAYVYLIAIGSSGTARVLQPFSGKPADAWMGAGELRKIPGDGDFLPLDKRAGNEVVLVVSASAPIPNLTRLLVHLEDAAPDSSALGEVLKGAGLEAGVLEFDHAGALSSGAMSATAPVAGNRSPAPGLAAPASQAAAVSGGKEQGEAVLGGLGSRISAFQSNQALPPQPGGGARAANTEINPFQVRPDAGTATAQGAADAAETADSAGSESGIGGTLANWFGLGSKPEPQDPATEPAVTAAADTYPLQAQATPPAPRVLPEPDSPAPATVPQVPLTQSSAAPAVKPRVTLVEPLAVEKSLQRSGDQAPPVEASADAVGDDTAATEIPENGRTAGLLASLFGPASTSETPPPEPAATSAAPMPILLDLEEDRPPAAQAEPGDLVAGAAQEPVAALPAAASEPPAEPPSPETDAPEGGGLLGWLSGGGSEPGDTTATASAPQAQPGSEVPAAMQPKQAPVTAAAAEHPEPPAVAVAPETDTESSDSGGGGLLGWLTGGSADSGEAASNAEQQAQAEIEAQVPPQPEPQAPATVTAAEQPEPPAAAVAPETETESSTSGGGLLGWLTGGSDQQAEGQESAAAPVAEPAPEPTEAPPQASPGSGILAGLGALFGGGTQADSAAADTGGKAEPAPDGAPLVRTEAVEPKAPAMTRHRNSQGQSVVVLSGPERPPSQAAAAAGATENNQVLSAQGSRIEALLEPEVQQQAPVPQQPEAGSAPAASREALPLTEPASAPVAASAAAPASAAVDSAATVPSPSAAEPPLQLNPEESQGNVTRLALNAAPAQAVKQAAAASGALDLSDDQGLAGAVVLVVSAAGTGAGVVINETGQVLTNWHLVRDLDRVSVAYKQPGAARIEASNLYPARVIQHSKYPDLALLEVQGGGPEAASANLAAAAGPARGKRLHTLHLADNGAWQPALATVERVRSGSSWYSGRRILHRGMVIRAQLQDRPGLSGVPLFNEHGEIAGLTTLVKPGKNQLVAVSAQTLRGFLKPPQ